jgi:transposase
MHEWSEGTVPTLVGRHNLLFRWFLGLNMDDAIWDATVFSKNRQRLLAGDIAEALARPALGRALHCGWNLA